MGGRLIPDQHRAHCCLGHEPKGCVRDAGCGMRTMVHDLLGPQGGVQVDGQAHGREDDETLGVWHLLLILVTVFACGSV